MSTYCIKRYLPPAPILDGISLSNKINFQEQLRSQHKLNGVMAINITVFLITIKKKKKTVNKIRKNLFTF